MKVLKTWPEKPRKLSQVDKAQPYLDGRIYQFDVEDCHELFGMPIEAVDYDGNADNVARYTEHLRERALYNLESLLRAGVRLTHGPYQTRLKYDGNTLIFQFTGLQECRFNPCDEKAIEDGRGYCQVHYTKKKSEGKVD